MCGWSATLWMIWSNRAKSRSAAGALSSAMYAQISMASACAAGERMIRAMLLSDRSSRCEQGATLRLDVLYVPLRAFASVKFFDSHHHLCAKVGETRLTHRLSATKFRKRIGHRFAFRNVASAFHRRFDEVLVFISDCDGECCHAINLSRLAAPPQGSNYRKGHTFFDASLTSSFPPFPKSSASSVFDTDMI